MFQTGDTVKIPDVYDVREFSLSEKIVYYSYLLLVHKKLR
jgi:hypothetical protein